jgi:DedD protein
MKQRLVGAVVLVSLAVIFIPMLLDGGDESGMPVFGSNIPEKPDYQFEPLDIPLEPVEPISEEKPVIVEKPEPQKAVEEKPPSAVKPEPQPVAAEAKKPAAKPAASKPQAKQETAVWVVQVGSFSSSENALKLRDKLRAKGFTAFVEKLKTEGKLVYRVRIGPELKREDAEATLDKLQRAMKMKGIVMGHSS